ncbi:MAG: hypothetical protein KDK51_04805 [Deltaproteobacteria bacterium]|nr:hypothetical protein [Deltaproteobacteria bacterium]
MHLASPVFRTKWIASKSDLWMVAWLLLVGLFLLSCFSGYSHQDTAISWLWRFSPLGLWPIDETMYAIPSNGSFAFQFGLSFAYLTVFAKTYLLEWPFIYFLTKGKSDTAIRDTNLICFLVNAISHPIVFFVFPAIFSRYVDALLAAETFAIVFECLAVYGLLFQLQIRLCWPTALITVILANLFSWQVGILLFAFV